MTKIEVNHVLLAEAEDDRVPEKGPSLSEDAARALSEHILASFRGRPTRPIKKQSR